jgi:cytochrome b561
MLHPVLEYLRKHQSPKIRYLHVIVLLLVMSQIIVSNFMGFAATGAVSGNIIKFYGTWIHIITGLTLLPIALLFAFFVIKEHGIKYFFPYVFGDFSQLKVDLLKIKNLELPNPEAKGLATIVQGLGLGALFLALFSGLTWFVSWKYHAPWAHSVKEVHEFLVGLIEAYIVGHGGMGLLHIYLSSRQK